MGARGTKTSCAAEVVRVSFLDIYHVQCGRRAFTMSVKRGMKVGTRLHESREFSHDGGSRRAVGSIDFTVRVLRRDVVCRSGNMQLDVGLLCDPRGVPESPARHCTRRMCERCPSDKPVRSVRYWTSKPPESPLTELQRPRSPPQSVEDEKCRDDRPTCRAEADAWLRPVLTHEKYRTAEATSCLLFQALD